MEKSKQLPAINVIKDVQQYLYDSSINRKGLSYSEILALTRKIRRGTCTTKHEVLAYDLKGIGLEIIYLTFPFFWQDIAVTYPEDIYSLLEVMPQQNHLALAILAHNSQIIVDITWDHSLEQAGFTVPKIGEEIVDTPLAVRPFANPVVHRTIDERAEYLRKRWEETPNYQEIGLFYLALNNWLLGIRSK